MKIIEAIKQLEGILKECGDIEIIHMEEVDGRFYMEWDRIFDVITVPHDDSEPKEGDELKGETVVAFMQQASSDEDGKPNPFKVIK